MTEEEKTKKKYDDEEMQDDVCEGTAAIFLQDLNTYLSLSEELAGSRAFMAKHRQVVRMMQEEDEKGEDMVKKPHPPVLCRNPLAFEQHAKDVAILQYKKGFRYVSVEKDPQVTVLMRLTDLVSSHLIGRRLAYCALYQLLLMPPPAWNSSSSSSALARWRKTSMAISQRFSFRNRRWNMTNSNNSSLDESPILSDNERQIISDFIASRHPDAQEGHREEDGQHLPRNVAPQWLFKHYTLVLRKKRTLPHHLQRTMQRVLLLYYHLQDEKKKGGVSFTEMDIKALLNAMAGHFMKTECTVCFENVYTSMYMSMASCQHEHEEKMCQNCALNLAFRGKKHCPLCRAPLSPFVKPPWKEQAFYHLLS